MSNSNILNPETIYKGSIFRINGNNKDNRRFDSRKSNYLKHNYSSNLSLKFRNRTSIKASQSNQIPIDKHKSTDDALCPDFATRGSKKLIEERVSIFIQTDALKNETLLEFLDFFVTLTKFLT